MMSSDGEAGFVDIVYLVSGDRLAIPDRRFTSCRGLHHSGRSGADPGGDVRPRYTHMPTKPAAPSGTCRRTSSAPPRDQYGLAVGRTTISVVSTSSGCEIA
jgi:hypothetical protein